MRFSSICFKSNPQADFFLDGKNQEQQIVLAFPQDMIRHILSFLSEFLRDLTHCMQLNKRWYTLIKEHTIWQELFLRHFPHLSTDITYLSNWYDKYCLARQQTDWKMIDSWLHKVYLTNETQTQNLKLYDSQLLLANYDCTIKALDLKKSQPNEFITCRKNIKSLAICGNKLLLSSIHFIEVVHLPNKIIQGTLCMQDDITAIEVMDHRLFVCLYNPDDKQRGIKVFDLAPLIAEEMLDKDMLLPLIEEWFPMQIPPHWADHDLISGFQCLKIFRDRLITCSHYCTILAWDLKAKKFEKILYEDPHLILCCQIFQNKLFIGLQYNQVRIFDLEKEQVEKSLYDSQGSSISCLEVAQGAIYTGSLDGEIQVWEALITDQSY